MRYDSFFARRIIIMSRPLAFVVVLLALTSAGLAACSNLPDVVPPGPAAGSSAGGSSGSGAGKAGAGGKAGSGGAAGKSASAGHDAEADGGEPDAG
jgi:hypothetical protein